MKSHGGQPGYHERLYKKLWAQLMLKHVVTDETTMKVLVWRNYKRLAMESLCKDFCSCLLVRQSDNARYGWVFVPGKVRTVGNGALQ